MRCFLLHFDLYILMFGKPDKRLARTNHDFWVKDKRCNRSKLNFQNIAGQRWWDFPYVMKTLQTLILIEWDWKHLTQEGYLSWWGFYTSISQGESDNISSRECITCCKDIQSHKPFDAWSNCAKQKVRQHQGQTTIKPLIRTLWLLLTFPSICQSGGKKGRRERTRSRKNKDIGCTAFFFFSLQVS